MDFKNASLEELKQFVKDNKIKGVSALRKSALIDFLEENYSEKSQEERPTKNIEKKNTEDLSDSKREESISENEKKPHIRKDKSAYVKQEKVSSVKYTRDTESEQQNASKQDFVKESKTYYSVKGQQHAQVINKKPVKQQPVHENKPKEEAAHQPERTEGYAKPMVIIQDAEGKLTPQQEASLAELDSGKTAHGILEIMPDGFGFIRSDNYLPGDQDVYVSPAQIKGIGLRTGDIIEGKIRIKTPREKFSALLYISSVNGEHPEVIAKRKAFEDLTPIFPNERIKMDGEGCPIPIRMIDLLSPIGKGQRGMIVSPPKTGKTTLLKQIAKCISQRYKDIHLLVLLIDERPEEVTDIRESIEGPNVEVIYSTFDELPEHHKRVSEMVIERAKRLVEQKQDVVILLDSITRLARAYNLTVAPSGRTLSGGLDPAALYMPKKFFGAARNMREGGSLTILATALVETGSKMDDVVFEEFKGTGNMEVVLDRKLAEKRIFPAIDLAKSSTRRDDLLLNKEEQEVVYALHKALSGNKADDMLEDVIKLFVRTKNNEEFMYYVKKSLLRR